MICYGDRSWCSSDCVNRDCLRNITPEHSKRAEKLGLPFAMVDYKTGCEAYLPPRPEKKGKRDAKV